MDTPPSSYYEIKDLNKQIEAQAKEIERLSKGWEGATSLLMEKQHDDMEQAQEIERLKQLISGKETRQRDKEEFERMISLQIENKHYKARFLAAQLYMSRADEENKRLREAMEKIQSMAKPLDKSLKGNPFHLSSHALLEHIHVTASAALKEVEGE